MHNLRRDESLVFILVLTFVTHFTAPSFDIEAACAHVGIRRSMRWMDSYIFVFDRHSANLSTPLSEQTSSQMTFCTLLLARRSFARTVSLEYEQLTHANLRTTTHQLPQSYQQKQQSATLSERHAHD